LRKTRNFPLLSIGSEAEDINGDEESDVRVCVQEFACRLRSVQLVCARAKKNIQREPPPPPPPP
jgi:hypothetical protein